MATVEMVSNDSQTVLMIPTIEREELNTSSQIDAFRFHLDDILTSREQTSVTAPLLNTDTPFTDDTDPLLDIDEEESDETSSLSGSSMRLRSEGITSTKKSSG